jgi:predicted ATP-dependent serine protease
MNYCENCGCKMYNGRCTNCHEELYILDQYYELGMVLPHKDSDFMKKVEEQRKEIKSKKEQNL